MATACIPGNASFEANQAPGGTNERNAVDEQIRRDNLSASKEEFDRAGVQEELSTASGTETNAVPEQPAPRDNIIANSMAKQATNPRSEMFTNWGIKGQQKLAEIYDAARTLVNGTSISDATMWGNFQNTVAKWFENDRHDLVHWISNVGDMADKTGRRLLASQNPLVQAIVGTIPKIRGMNSIFMGRIDKIQRDLAPIATREGKTIDQLWESAGHYLNYLHATEGNTHLLDTWEKRRLEAVREREEFEAKIAQGERLKASERKKYNEAKRDERELPKQIEELKANLNNPYPPAKLKRRNYTNAEAARLMAELERTSGMTREELRRTAKAMSTEFNYITKELAQYGLIEPELLTKFPEFEWYAPQVTKEQNSTTLGNDTSIYMAANYHAMDGTAGGVDSAAATLGWFAKRAATEIGSIDMGSALAGLALKQKKLEINSQAKAAGKAYDKTLPEYQDIGLRMGKLSSISEHNRVGMTVRVPTRMPDGTIKTERMHIYFKNDYQFGNTTGIQLNNAINGNFKLGNPLIEGLKTLTGWYGQSFTRFQPGFAIVGGLRDYMERGVHILNRAYYTDAGVRIEGSNLILNFYANSTRGTHMLMEAVLGRAPEGSAAAKYFDEFQREGVYQRYLPDKYQQPQSVEELSKQFSQLDKSLRKQGLNSIADQLQRAEFKDFRRGLETMKDGGRRVMRRLDQWSDILQNSAAFTHYITLREAGLSPRRAGAGARDLMDLSKSGTIANYLSVISPFMRPTMQGAKALAHTFGLNARTPGEILKEGKKGWIALAAAGMAYSVLYPLVRQSLGQDEAGDWRADKMKVGQLTSSLPIGIGDAGEYFRMPTGFGPQRIAATFGVCMDRIFRGAMEPAEAAFHVMYAVGRDIAPSNAPQFDFKDDPAGYIMRLVTPAGLTPFLDLSTNKNTFGNKVYNDYNPDKPLSEQGRKSTPAIWHSAARWIYQHGGPDWAPEELMHFVKSMTFGPVRLITNSITNIADKTSTHMGMEMPDAYAPIKGILQTMGTSLFFGRTGSTERNSFYAAKRDLMDEVRRKGVDLDTKGLKDEEKTGTLLKRMTDAGVDEDRARQVLALREAQTELRGLGTEFNKQWDGWENGVDDQDALLDAFNAFEAEQKKVYVKFLKQLEQ